MSCDGLGHKSDNCHYGLKNNGSYLNNRTTKRKIWRVIRKERKKKSNKVGTQLILAANFEETIKEEEDHCGYMHTAFTCIQQYELLRLLKM